ncbi:MAG: nuclear transport factor 2 family protein [Myxococcota bacterium]
MTHPHEELITRFYQAFQDHDGLAMADCYHADATFTDPAFGELKGPRPGHMWRMLTGQATSLTLEVSGIEADENGGKAHWEARYPFGPGARPVHNVIFAFYASAAAEIYTHKDHFDFWRWSRMALGPAGVLLGWTPMLKNKVQTQALSNLAKWEGQNITAQG